MSYILDALRRADAERERGGVPGLHTQTMNDAGDDTEATRAPRGLKPWHWVAMGLAGGLAVAIAWTWRGDEPPAPPAVRPAPPPMPVQQSAAPPALPPPAAATPEPAPAAPVAIAPMRAAPPPPAPAATARQAAPAASAAPSAVAASIPRVGSLAELPPELRSGLPALAFGGSIYSNTPANRLLIVNGQLMHEGESLGAGVVLEQIKPKAAVLSIRGQRVEVGL